MPKPGHGIKPLLTTRIPASIITMAVAAKLAGGRAGYVETFRCAATRWQLTIKGEQADGWARTREDLYTMWHEISQQASRPGVTFLFVHDLQRVARLTNMLHWLPELAWSLDALSLNPGAPWMVFRRRGSTLKVVDLMSIWPTSIDKIGGYFGLSQRNLPGDNAQPLEWIAYVRRDLGIVNEAVDQYLAWIVREDLGSLAVTGNGQAWTAFRRQFMDIGILVHHDEDLLEMERRAMWAGRCEAYWHGSLQRQVVDEWDFSNAHNSIARDEDLPVFPHAPIDPDKPLEKYLADKAYHVLAEIEVETSVPCLPTMSGGHIVWPVGVFRTVVWSPELRIALDTCRSVRVIRGWQYRSAPALRRWADWVFSQLAADDDAVPAPFKDLVKRWGNTLIGRFAMRYPQWEKLGRASVSDVYCTPCVDVATGDEYMLMQVGYEMWQQNGMAVPNNSAPMVTGYVMSVMRAKMWHLSKAMPYEALLYMDTDSLLVTDRWRTWMEMLAQSKEGQGLRLKRSWEGMNIYGPRQLVTGDAVRIAGLPKTAHRLSRHAWEGETVESLQQAMAARSADAVRITPRQWEIEGVDTRRSGPAVGWTYPFVVGNASGLDAVGSGFGIIAGRDRINLSPAGDHIPDDTPLTR